MASHRYWRIYITANNGAVVTSIGEIEMRGSVSGTDLCTGGTASASSENSGAYAASLAFDNDTTTTRWAMTVAGVTPCWIKYDFGSDVFIAEVKINAPWEFASDQSPQTFDIQYSDDNSSWTTLRSITGQTTWSNSEARYFATYPYNFSGDITESQAITDWRVTAVRCKDGLNIGTATTSGTTYSVDVSTTEPFNLIIAPKIDYKWSASKVVALNDYCVPTDPDTTPRLYKATDIGSSPHQTHSTTEPTWPASSTVTDNDITWTFVADLVDPISLGPKIAN